jgi:hypothetical protein
MAIGFLHGTLVFSVVVLCAAVGSSHAYAAVWFTTYGAGVLSGQEGDASIKTVQPYFSPTDLFKSTLVQPGVVSPVPTMPDFGYGALIARQNYDVKETSLAGATSPTEDAFVKHAEGMGDALPEYQRFVDAATSTIPASCNRAKLLTACNLAPGIYKASLANINSSLNDLNGQKYHVAPNEGGLLILVQEDPASTGTLAINYNVAAVPSAGSKRLVLVTNGRIAIGPNVGTAAPATQAAYLAREADIQAMLITTTTSDPSIDVLAGSTKSVKIEGPLIAKGKVRFRRNADAGIVKWPGVFVEFNPMYTTEFARLDSSMALFGPAAIKWTYD